jgi:Ca-activated chloride channel family protein
MKWLGTLLTAAAAFAMLLAGPPAGAGETPGGAPGDEGAQSPYFAIDAADPSVDRLPLKATRADVTLLGPIAEVTVTQHYRNEGQRPIEARYVFPGSTRAAVHAMSVRLGDRLLTARIQEKQAARVEYEQARRDGKTAGLLEQHRPNVFGMNVANIMPGDDVRVELRYTELLVPRDGRYEFVFPTVVGPRYNAPQGEAAQERWVAAPYLRAGQPPRHGFDLRLTLATPLPPRDVESPSHAIDVAEPAGQRVAVSLVDDGRPFSDRDFVLRYGLAGDAIESGLMLFEGQDENFFLAMVQPPRAPEPTAILPRDYVFVVDISGSMHGFPLDTAKVLMRQLLGGLRPSDSFNVMLFSGSARTLAHESVPATQANVNAALQMLRQTAGGGGTEIVPALEAVAALPKRADVSRTVVVVTDGYVAVEREVFQLVRSQLDRSNVFAFGIGSSVNRHLIEGIARAGQGEPFVITKPAQAAAAAERFRRMVEAPVLTQVKVRFDGLQAYDIEPARLPDVLGGRPVVVVGKWKGEARGTVAVEGRNAAGPQAVALDVASARSGDTAAVRQLWARQRIASLADEEALLGGQPHKEAITRLGLRYSLLSDHTSFIAVDHRLRNTGSLPTADVDQPSPLPQGVSELAIGAHVPSTPEPTFWAAAVAMLFVLLLTRPKRWKLTPPKRWMVTPPKRLRRLPPGGATSGPAEPDPRWPLDRAGFCVASMARWFRD